MLAFEIVIIGILGLILGSFVSCITYRIPHDKPWLLGRSCCTECKNELAISDLIPLISWVINNRKCRYCEAPISYIYPSLEMLHALLAIIGYLVFGKTWDFLYFISVLPFLSALFFIDLKYFILPNILVLVCSALGLIRIVHTQLPDFIFYILAALLYAFPLIVTRLIMNKIMRRDVLGIGDIKFFAVAGLWLGLPNIAAFYILSGFFGVTFSLIWRYYTKEKVFPFGPALISAFIFIFMIQGFGSSHFLQFHVK